MRPAVYLRKPLHTLFSLERGTGSAHEMADMMPLFVACPTIAGIPDARAPESRYRVFDAALHCGRSVLQVLN
jgi:hypothetical protein